MVKEISILMTALNVDDLLYRAIKSIVENDFPKNRYELIVVYELNNEEKKKEIVEYAKRSGLDARIIKIKSTRHIGFNRRKLVEFARYKYLLFTDADCVVPRNWIKTMYNEIKTSDEKTGGVVGSVKVPKSTFLGDCISSLGFPGGAFIGFDKMFYVDKNGYTNQISTGNVILKTDAVKKVGSFSMDYVCLEDKDMALKLIEHGYKIKFSRNSYVMHPPTASWTRLMKRLYIKGYDSYTLLKNHEIGKDMTGTRLRSIKNILSYTGFSTKLPVVLFLLFTGYISQIIGYTKARFSS